MKNNDAVHLIYPLSDALMMTLRYDHKSRVIRGDMDVQLPVTLPDAEKEINFKMIPKVLASYIDDTDSAVLVKLRKRLWCLVWYQDTARTISLQLIDAEVLQMHEVDWAKGNLGKPVEAFRKFAKGTKALFQRPVEKKRWRRLDDAIKPDAVDRGFEDQPEQLSGQPDTPAQNPA